MSRAAKLAEDWKGRARFEQDDLRGLGLPQHVQAAILDVQNHSTGIAERVALAEAIHAQNPSHPDALEPGSHEQSEAAYRFEEVDGEIVEIRKDSAAGHVRIIHRPDLVAASEVDPVAALEALRRAASTDEEVTA